MSILAWIILGLISGIIASKVVNRGGQGFMLDVGLGVAGAVVGGWLFTAIGARGVTGLDLWSIVVSAFGATITLAIYHALFRRPRSADDSLHPFIAPERR